MSGLALGGLAFQSVLFLAWAYLALSVLFHLRKRAADRTGRHFPGPASFIAATREWLADPNERRRRLWLFVLTGALYGLMAVIWTLGD